MEDSGGERDRTESTWRWPGAVCRQKVRRVPGPETAAPAALATIAARWSTGVTTLQQSTTCLEGGNPPVPAESARRTWPPAGPGSGRVSGDWSSVVEDLTKAVGLPRGKALYTLPSKKPGDKNCDLPKRAFARHAQLVIDWG